MNVVLDRRGVHVRIMKDRWTVRVEVGDGGTSEPAITYVMSWDRAFGGGEMWFGTEAEYEEELEKL